MTVINACPLCGNNQLKPFLTCTDYTVSRETFELKECSACRFVMTTPRPDDNVIGSYYQSDDYISHANKASSLVDHIYLIARTFTLNWKLKLLNKHTLHSDTQKKLLDYGCGTGEFLKNCQDNHWNISGVEPSANARAQAVTLTKASIAESINDLKEQEFDAITLWHVLEHIPDLNAILQQLKSRLKKGGTIFIAVPNHKSWDGKHYQQHWAGYDVPRHLWHFSSENMKQLLQNNSLHLQQILPMKLDAFYISLLSEKYRNSRAGLATMISATLSGIKSNLLGKKTGEFSSLIYIIKK